MAKTSTGPGPGFATRPAPITRLPRARRFAFPDSPLPWLTPLALVLLFVFLYPVVALTRLSFTDADLLGALLGAPSSYTLHSWARLIHAPNFANMLSVTVIFVAGSVVLQMLLGFLIAEAVRLGQQRGLRGTILTRTAVLSAWAIPGVIIGVIWKLLYHETDAGILTYLLHPLFGHDIAFLSDPHAALISLIVANVWRGTAFSMIFIYAGLQTLPQDVTEAAKVDGANGWQQLTRVTIPQLTPILLVNLLIILIDTFNTFDMGLALTGGGPGQSTEVIALNAYHTIFVDFNLGVGAATTVLLLLINLSMTILYIRFVERGSSRARGAGHE